MNIGSLKGYQNKLEVKSNNKRNKATPYWDWISIRILKEKSI